jgi:hypothetical protein
MSEIFSEQLTAAATLALAVLALVAGALAGLALWRQTQEVSLLLEQNQRDTDERRRSQASRVFIGAPPDEGLLVHPYARNASDFPVYNAQVWYNEPGSITGPDDLGVIMPGETRYAPSSFRHDDALKHAFLLFRDAEGIDWIRTPTGQFRQQRGRAPSDEVNAWNIWIAIGSPVDRDGRPRW